MTPKQMYQIGQLARNAFMCGRGRGEGDRLTDEDQKAFAEYTESRAFDILCERIDRDFVEGTK